MIAYTVKVFDSGDRFWYNQDDRFHREDGPAIEWADGMKEWWVNGRLHREDGPAVESVDGTKIWYLNGEELTEEEFNWRTNKIKELTVAEISELLGYEVKVIK
jgi:hypothetical protein